MQRPYVIRPTLLCALSLGVAATAFSGGTAFQEDSSSVASSHSPAAVETDATRPHRSDLSPWKDGAPPASPRPTHAGPKVAPAGRGGRTDASFTPAVPKPGRPVKGKDLAVLADVEVAMGHVLDAVTGGTPLEVLPLALDRSHFLRLSLAGDLRASFRILEHPELLLSADDAAAARAGSFKPTREHVELRLALYQRLITQAGLAQTLETFEVLEHVRADRRSGWLDSVGALSVLLELERAHGMEPLGRWALLERAQLIAREGQGTGRFEGAAARLFTKLLAAPEADIVRAAGDALWRLTNLRAGVAVPGLCGNDPDGNELCIHDFRGRVLLVRFWSASDLDFVGNCAREAELVDRFWDHPFALIGLNRDADRERYLRQREEYAFPGNQIYEGPLDEGLIDEVRVRKAQRPNAFDSWRETGTGGTYLIDSHGVVRATDPLPERLPELIQELISEHYRETRARGF